MGYKRLIHADALPSGDQLSAALAGIGMAFVGRPNFRANIEDTLLAASLHGMEHDGLRELAVLTTWWDIHAAFVNADRLTVLVSSCDSRRVRVFWAALAGMKRTDPRFARLGRLRPRGGRVPLLSVGNDFQVARRGEDPRFARSPLVVAEGTLRARASDVAEPAVLARHHAAYRARVMIGPSYRADMWAALEHDPSVTATALARATYGSIATAWRVKREYSIWRAATSAAEVT